MVTVDRPYEQTISLAIDKANRLHSLRAHPGFNDLVALSEETVRIAERELVEFAGWDKDELVARSIAFRAAKKSHERLFMGIMRTIQEGIEEAAILRGSEDPYSREAVEMADELRLKVLQHAEATNYETRIPGSY